MGQTSLDPIDPSSRAVKPNGMRSVWWVAASTTLVVLSFGMFGPVLAVLLQQRGYGTAAVGAFAMIAFACVAIIMPFMPRLVSRFGLRRCYIVGMFMETAGTLGYCTTDSFAMWCAYAVLGGSGAAAVWNCTESLLAQNAPPDQRGRVMGLYQTALGGALALGPFVPALLGWLAQTTLLAAAAIQLAALMIVLLTGVWRGVGRGVAASPVPRAGSAAVGLHATTTLRAALGVPALVVIAFVGGVFEAGLGSVSAANGANMGLSLAQAASIAGALGLGSFLFQLPAGLAADRFSQQTVFSVAGVLLLVSAVGFYFAAQYPWILWASAWIWGGVGGALYTLTMVRVAHDFSAASVAAGTAAMITGYTVGGALGPVISGAVLQWAGAIGLSFWLGTLALVVVGAAASLKGSSLKRSA